MAYQTPWMCVNNECNHIIGYVSGGEFPPADDVFPSDISTRGSNLIVRCPQCGTIKTWYSSDQMNRIINQLMDVMAESIAKRAIHTIHTETK